VLAIVERTIQFKQNEPKKEHFGEVISSGQLVQKAKIDGKVVAIPVNEGTALYNQLRKYLQDNEMELPVKIMDETFTVMYYKGASRMTSVLYKELIEDMSSLFDF
jgi:hypothetical protein